jgi:hypothetical protein
MTTPVFHRLTVPTYFGGLPSNFDYINNATSGVPAAADGQRSSGVNDGTYFVAFTDDATSSNVNRPAQALAQNTDFIDNILHADLAVEWPSATITSAGGGDTGATIPFALTGPIFMGGSQDKNFGFIILDAAGDQINVAGTVAVVHTATDLGSTPVTAGSGGFSTGDVQLTYNVVIPAGVVYNIIFGRRTQLASLPADALIRGAERSYKTIFNAQELLRQLHGNSEAWNASWDSTIFDLTTRGLNGLYNLSTTGGGGTENTPGAGAVATRTAQALTMETALTDRSMVDRFNAEWLADLTGDATVATNGGYGALGSTGFISYFTRWSLFGETPAAPAVAPIMSALRREYPIADPSVGMGYWTRISADASATITTGAFPGLYLLTLDNTSESYFWKDDANNSNIPRSAVALSRDLFELTLSTGKKITVRAMQHSGTAKAIYVTAPDGGPSTELASLPVSVTSLRWVTPTFVQGNGALGSKQSFLGNPLGLATELYNDDGLYLVMPPPATDVNSIPSTSPSAGAYTQYNGPGGAVRGDVSLAYMGRDTDLTDGNRVLGWGSFAQNSITGLGSRWLELGYLTSDGGVQAGYRQQIWVAQGTGDTSYGGNRITVSGTGTQSVILDLDHFDDFFIDLSNASGCTLLINVTSPQTTRSATPSGYPLQVGRKIRVVILQIAAGCALTGGGFLSHYTSTSVKYPVPWGTGGAPPLQGTAGAVDIYELEVLPLATVLGNVQRY